jgi:DNA polymerase III subunit gamma/tau
MSYKALYLTYRPQTFEEIAGQKAIVRTLKNALASNKMAHAYLFAGPRGTGKTTMARLFAKALNCEQGVGQQCNKCSNCLAISDGTHPDVVEIDAASNNGVDQVRDLIDKVKYAPIKGRYKVYIIDEVHMMSTGAFNALLKTLEEPPENVIFILATTEPYKVIPTILSRCQRFDFSKLSDEEMEGKLKEVLLAEKTDYEEKGLKTIISLADGGMRDALSILDQVLAYSGNKLREDDVLTLFGLASDEEKIALLKAVHEGDVSAVIAKSENFLSGGVDIRRLTSDLLGILKDLLIYEKTKEPSLLEKIDETEAKGLASVIADDEVNAMIDVLLKTEGDFRNVSDARSLFELTLVQLASLSKEAPFTTKVPSATPEEKPAADLVVPIAAPKITAAALSVEADKPVPQPAPVTAPAPEEKKTKGRTGKKFAPPPEFLFSEETKEPVAPSAAESAIQAPTIVSSIDTSKILKPGIATEGDMNKLPDDEIIKIMVLGNKTERTALSLKWDQFDSLKGDSKLGNLATLLSEGHPFCLCQEAILLSYNFTKLRDKANIIANQEPLAELLEAVLGRKVFVYAIDRIECNRLQQEYFSLMQVDKLPKKETIVLDLPKEATQ